ncbi:MAG TPA: hypothetical protein VEP94_01880 [Solirubrobacterales bacterium]|nr:hypothetical protein [Solirubrobacterales bacterium]
MAAKAGPGRYRCPSCKEVKDQSEFYATKTKGTGISHYCKACAREKQRHVRQLTSAYRFPA